MPSIIITAQVEDAKKWEAGFRTHGELFKEYSATAIHFATSADNEVAIHWQVDDADRYLELLDSPATAEAMDYDGVRKETVKVFVLDKEFIP